MRALYVHTNFNKSFGNKYQLYWSFRTEERAYSGSVEFALFLQKNLQMQQFAHFRKASAWLWSVTNHYLFPAK